MSGARASKPYKYLNPVTCDAEDGERQRNAIRAKPACKLDALLFLLSVRCAGERVREFLRSVTKDD